MLAGDRIRATTNAHGDNILGALTWRQRATFAAHLFKAVCKQHHRELIPFLAEIIPPEAVVVDVGAHAGQFAKIFSRLAFQGRVFAFEPGSYARLILSIALRARGRRNVTVLPMALGEREQELTLSLPLKASGSLGFGLANLADADTGDRPRWRETVPVTTLDRIVAQENLARLDFIKADIEGWEMQMLRGARAVITRHRPAVMLEIAAPHLRRAGAEPAEIGDFFSGLGYRAHRMVAGRPAAEIAESLDDGDHLFLP